jgi:hypothetical protein
MTAMTNSTIGFIFAVVIFASPSLAMAQRTEVGVLSAVAGEEPVPTSGPIAVAAEIPDFTDSAVTQLIERALTDRGYVIRFDASLLLTFGLQRAHDVGPDPSADNSAMQANPEEEEPSVDFGEQGTGDAPQMPDVVLTYDFGGDGEFGAPVQYNLDLIVGDSDDPPLWQGSMTATLPTSDTLKAAQVMVPQLIAHLGEAVPARRVYLEQP